MENTIDWGKKIIEITEAIKMQYPEAYPFLNEMPVTIPDEKIPHIDADTLKAYYHSLLAFAERYACTHIVEQHKG
jgi:hypothetical protein